MYGVSERMEIKKFRSQEPVDGSLWTKVDVDIPWSRVSFVTWRITFTVIGKRYLRG